jgi:hypothetical protein
MEAGSGAEAAPPDEEETHRRWWAGPEAGDLARHARMHAFAAMAVAWYVREGDAAEAARWRERQEGLERRIEALPGGGRASEIDRRALIERQRIAAPQWIAETGPNAVPRRRSGPDRPGTEGRGIAVAWRRLQNAREAGDPGALMAAEHGWRAKRDASRARLIAEGRSEAEVAGWIERHKDLGPGD